MPVLSFTAAARLAGVDRQTIRRAVQSGKLSATSTPDGKKGIELSELLRVWPDATAQGAPSEEKNLEVKWLPTKTQWANWSLPSKYTTASFVLGIFGIILAILFYFYPKQSTDVNIILDKQKELLERLNIKTNENDIYGLTAFRIGSAYENMEQAQSFLESLKWYRKAMLEGDREACRKIIESYGKLIQATVDIRNNILNVLFVLNEQNDLLFFDFYTVPIEKATKDSKHVHNTEFKIPKMKGKIRFIFCVDVLNIVEESDENNCEDKQLNVS